VALMVADMGADVVKVEPAGHVSTTDCGDEAIQ
jgi:hypothetical protein